MGILKLFRDSLGLVIALNRESFDSRMVNSLQTYHSAEHALCSLGKNKSIGFEKEHLCVAYSWRNSPKCRNVYIGTSFIIPQPFKRITLY